MKKFKFNPLKILVYSAAIFTFAIIAFIIGYLLVKGVPEVINEIGKKIAGEPSMFDWKYNSSNASLVPATINTLVLIAISITISTILGIGTAIYLVEYAKSGNKVVELIRITSETLSGIPSIIYGLFGMLFFVKYLQFGFSLLSGILTISIMILPLIIRSTEEALKAVPDTFREASFGLGAGKLRTIFVIILPSAINGILAGIILAIGRIIGETAALLYTSGTTTGMSQNPLTDGGRTLSIHMYMLTSEGTHFPQAYATAAILLLIILLLNGGSTLIAKQLTKNRNA
ncbi:MAG: phosphate ABC transporter permease PstA [Clostridia bacterium]